MLTEKKCLVGRDSDDGVIFAIVMIVIVVSIIIAIMVYGGIFIGGFHSLKNYAISFKHNVIDSNRTPVTAS